MSSLVDNRLRVRSDRKQFYTPDESDDDADLMPGKSQTTQEKFERIVRSDAKKDSCQACGKSGNLLSCKTCTYSFHTGCLLSPLKSSRLDNWMCPECVNPLNDIDKILDCKMRPTVAGESDAENLGCKQSLTKQYLVKWKGLSYMHCRWVPEQEFLKAFNINHHLKTRVNNFHRQMGPVRKSDDDDFVAIRPEWTTVHRILACRENSAEKEYLVKWKELPYDECHWELESDISSFQAEIERFDILRSRSRKISYCKQKNSVTDDAELIKQQNEFQQYEHSPKFLSGGKLHPYQLEGLNFLRFSWSKQTHVILADEMGLGKTIQSIAFLASLFKENASPHLVVAPLSTLRNWEREFERWAPQMNVVMYVGSAQARSIIREYEFYFSKNPKKNKKKNSKKTFTTRKLESIKFDVLLTSYEIINQDTAPLKHIKWECMIVDEGHRLKNKDSKLFSSLKQYSSRHRVLLTGTPLQNNLDELFMLMHFLDAGKFRSLEEFQEEFKDINQEQQVSRLHTLLAPHLLRRVKKDVMTELPPKKELIIRVELSSKQREYYKAILTRNYDVLTRHGGAQISLKNVVMELRKLCCHPYMLEGVEPVLHKETEAHKQMLESSGKLQLLDKLMMKLKEQGHRVLIFSQFKGMLDMLQNYCVYKHWQYERIDGNVDGAERQVRIDRFNAEDSSRFCFLLSTRAGGLGINLATADTVIIYDSDWNPHADLQAMARAHRVGQTNKVLIFRLITRGTIEERMMELTKKKMVLEHIVVGRKAQNIKQEELDDIIRYGSKELFADENDLAGKSRQIHYDDAAIDRLLERDQVEDEEATLNDEDESGFLKAFKVANFEYVDKAEAAEEKENNFSVSSSEGKNFWEELLKDKHQEQQVEVQNALGKGKRNRTTLLGENFARLEDVGSDGEDVDYEVDLTDGDSNSTRTTTARRPSKKKAYNTNPPPLMEGEGRSLKVLGFTQRQRAAFLHTLMRFGVGDFDWKDFIPHMKPKTYEEINEYGTLFLSHIAEDINVSPTFSDGVPKEGLQIDEVLVRISVLSLIREKVNFASENPGTPLFSDDILSRYAGLRSTKIWKEEHDLVLLHAVLKHGYGKWPAIVDDKDLNIQMVICQELNTPFINLPLQGQVGSQVKNGANMTNVESPLNQSRENNGSATAVNGAHGSCDATSQEALHQLSDLLLQYRNMQRRQIEFIRKRLLLLENCLNEEYYQKEYSDKMKETAGTYQEPEKEPTQTQTIYQLPQVEKITSGEFSISACDNDPNRSTLLHLYNEMCDVVAKNTEDLVHTSMSVELTKLETIVGHVNKILTPNQSSQEPVTNSDNRSGRNS